MFMGMNSTIFKSQYNLDGMPKLQVFENVSQPRHVWESLDYKMLKVF